jgi:competence protein ComEC
VVGYSNTKILVETVKFPEFAFGDNLRISGVIINPENIKPFDNFDYGGYLLKKGIRGQIKNPKNISKISSGGNRAKKQIYSIGDRFKSIIIKAMPEPFAAFQIGLLFGNKTNIPDSLMSAFNRTGTTHIVAVSGYNLTIIITTLALIMALFSRKLAFVGTILLIIFFIILTGAGASVLRAGVLAGLVSFARFSGRRPYVPLLILLTIDTMLLFNPYALVNDVSFQLSFLAFIGLVVIAPLFEEMQILRNWPKVLKLALCETLGAQTMVLPILLYNFGILSVVAPIANILILPLIPLAMGLGFAIGISGIIWVGMSRYLAIVSYFLLKYIIVVVEKLSAVPWAAVSIETNYWWWIPIYYVAIGIIVQKLKMRNEKSTT